MIMVTWFMKKPRLVSLIGAAGGMTVVSALRAAEANNETLRAGALDAVDAILADLEGLTARAPEDATAWLDRVYALSSSLLDVAGPFGLADMCKAAYSLCDLADRQKRAGLCEAAPVQVHVASLKLLRQLDQPPAARALILAGLEKLLVRAQRTAG